MDSKIVLIGTGHVFDLKEKLRGVIEEEMPDAIALELDIERASALLNAKKDKVPLFYLLLSKVQNAIAHKFGVKSGGEMLTAMKVAKELDVPILYIDMNAREVIIKLWNSMTLKRKIVMLLSSFLSLFWRKEKIEKEIKKFEENSEKFTEEMEKHFPEIKKILIDERNEYMARKLKDFAEKYNKIVAVVGEGHVNGLENLLKDFAELKIIHLSQLMSQ